MVDAGRPGCMVTIGSQAGHVGLEERAAYCASKGGVMALTRAMALESAEYGIRVNAVASTFVMTPLNRSTRERADMRDKFLSRIPM